VEIELSLPVDLRQALGRGEAEQTLAPADLFHADHEQGQAEEDGADKPGRVAAAPDRLDGEQGRSAEQEQGREPFDRPVLLGEIVESGRARHEQPGSRDTQGQ
jgi:hypothetical protein